MNNLITIKNLIPEELPEQIVKLLNIKYRIKDLTEKWTFDKFLTYGINNRDPYLIYLLISHLDNYRDNLFLNRTSYLNIEPKPVSYERKNNKTEYKAEHNRIKESEIEELKIKELSKNNLIEQMENPEFNLFSNKDYQLVIYIPRINYFENSIYRYRKELLGEDNVEIKKDLLISDREISELSEHERLEYAFALAFSHLLNEENLLLVAYLAKDKDFNVYPDKNGKSHLTTKAQDINDWEKYSEKFS